MVIGGLKHRTQRFNPQSVGVSATLMFISVTGKDCCMLGVESGTVNALARQQMTSSSTSLT